MRQFPSVSIFNVGDLLAQVRAVIDKAATAVQSVFVFTLLAGITVLFAAVQASRDERGYETAILRALGAGRGLLLRSTLAEFVGLGSARRIARGHRSRRSAGCCWHGSWSCVTASMP